MTIQTLSASSMNDIVVDAGAVFVNGTAIGATKGGPTFGVEQNVRNIEIDGARGPIMGGRRVTSEKATLTVTFMEMSAANLSNALFGMTSGSQRDLSAAPSYLNEVTLVAPVSGSSTDGIVVTLFNALADGNFEMSLEDENEAGVEVQFAAHFDPTTMSTSPYKIERTTLPNYATGGTGGTV